jgi:hypothetical protein
MGMATITGFGTTERGTGSSPVRVHRGRSVVVVPIGRVCPGNSPAKREFWKLATESAVFCRIATWCPLYRRYCPEAIHFTNLFVAVFPRIVLILVGAGGIVCVQSSI